jgi:hypothetical protein
MTLISTTTLTGADVTLSSIPQTYIDLYILVRDCDPATDQTGFRMQFNSDATASRHERTLSNTASGSITFSQDQLTMTGDMDNSVVKNLIIGEIPDYTNATTMKMCIFNSIVVSGVTTTNGQAFRGVGYYNQTGAITSLKFSMSGGNFDGGTIYLYGVK